MIERKFQIFIKLIFIDVSLPMQITKQRIFHFAEWTKSDRNEQSHKILNDEKIIWKVTGHNTPTDELKEEEEEEE